MPLWGPWTKGSQYVVPASADHSDDSDRVVHYRFVDLAGNVAKARQVKVLIDTRAPRVTVLPGTYSTRITAFDLAGNASDPPGQGTLVVK